MEGRGFVSLKVKKEFVFLEVDLSKVEQFYWD
jgi:hypothetical protein